MAAQVHKPRLRLNLNLLYPQGTPQQLYLKFIKWLISYGRFIVIVVEIIVLGSFAYRFKLDADLDNLKEQINRQIPYLQSLNIDEALIKQTQLRLSTIKTNYTSSPSWAIILQTLSSQAPEGVRLNILSLQRPSAQNPTIQFKFTAEARSNNDIAVFLYGLKKDNHFKNINLTNISFEQGTINFGVSGETK